MPGRKHAMSTDDLIHRIPESYLAIKEKIHEQIVGMDEVVDLLLSGILSRGHILLVGVPGLAKTLLIKTLSDLLDLQFSRIQFTPDLMPSDIIGTEVILDDSDTGTRHFSFMHGPVFCNILLADEINRTPPKTQAALMEAMEEHQVTMGGKSYDIEQPFFVLATQNPIEQEGTYPLPAAQLDRFTFMVNVEYPNLSEEYRIIRMTTAPSTFKAEKILGREEILQLTDLVARLEAPRKILSLATNLARLTRPGDPAAPESVKKYLAWGVGPRGAQGLIQTAKVRALLHGRRVPGEEDIRILAPHVFRHRMIMNFQGAAEDINADDILADVFDAASPRRSTSVRS